MNTTPSSALPSPFPSPSPSPSGSDQPSTALVLGGGGSTGNAWLIGVIAGLAEAGLDVTDAGLIVGTSAGATAAAQITAAPLPELLALTLAAPPAAATRRPPGRDSGRPPSAQVSDHLGRLAAIITASADQADLRRRLGAAALDLEAASDGSASARWRSIVAARLPKPDWPDQALALTAIDALTGDPVVFYRDSGVELADAVAASTSSGLPYRIGDRPYLDGGFRINAENADLAAGRNRVLVLTPFGGRSLVPAAWGTHLPTQVEELRANGAQVEVVAPDSESEYLFGPNGMDLSLRPAAGRAGHAQGKELAARLADFWR